MHTFYINHNEIIIFCLIDFINFDLIFKTQIYFNTFHFLCRVFLGIFVHLLQIFASGLDQEKIRLLDVVVVQSSFNLVLIGMQWWASLSIWCGILNTCYVIAISWQICIRTLPYLYTLVYPIPLHRSHINTLNTYKNIYYCKNENHWKINSFWSNPIHSVIL